MTEDKLNEKYIKNNIKGVCQDCMYLEMISPIIRKLISEAYVNGLDQKEFDVNMDLLEQDIKLKLELEKANAVIDSHNELIDKLQGKINEAINYINLYCDTNITEVTEFDSLPSIQGLLSILEWDDNNE